MNELKRQAKEAKESKDNFETMPDNKKEPGLKQLEKKRKLASNYTNIGNIKEREMIDYIKAFTPEVEKEYRLNEKELKILQKDDKISNADRSVKWQKLSEQSKELMIKLDSAIKKEIVENKLNILPLLPDRINPEEKREIIGSPEFKKWFGSSKVVNKEGEAQENYTYKPIKVYHGTSSGGFREFSKEKDKGNNLYGAGFYFTEDLGIAEEYSTKDIKPDEEYLKTLKIKDKKVFNEFVNDLEKELFGKNGVYKNAGNDYKKQEFANFKKFTAQDLNGDVYKLLHGDKSFFNKSHLEAALKLEKKYGINFHPQREIKEVFLAIKNPKDLTKPVEANEIDDVLKHSEKFGKYDGFYFKHILDEFYQPADNKEGYVEIKLPNDKIHKDMKNGIVNKDTVNKLFEYIKKYPAKLSKNGYSYGFNTPLSPDGKMTWENLYYILSDSNWSRRSKDIMTDYFKNKGHDGLTHVGGHNIGERDHKVWIAFEPNQIKATTAQEFDPNSHDMYKSFQLELFDNTSKLEKGQLKLFNKEGNQVKKSIDNIFVKASNRAGLTKKTITNKMGKQQTVWVREGEQMPGDKKKQKENPLQDKKIKEKKSIMGKVVSILGAISKKMAEKIQTTIEGKDVSDTLPKDAEELKNKAEEMRKNYADKVKQDYQEALKNAKGSENKQQLEQAFKQSEAISNKADKAFKSGNYKESNRLYEQANKVLGDAIKKSKEVNSGKEKTKEIKNKTGKDSGGKGKAVFSNRTDNKNSIKTSTKKENPFAKIAQKSDNKVAKVMREYKQSQLNIGRSDKKVKDRKQAIAIALNQKGK